MFFLDSEHVRMGRMNSPLPPPTKKIIWFFKLYVWFLKIILLVHDFFFVAAIIKYALKVCIT